MTKSRVWFGCALMIAAVCLFAASFVVVLVENCFTGKLVAGHLPLWVLLAAFTAVAFGAVIALTVEPHVTGGRRVVGQVIEVRPGPDPTEDEPKVVVRYEVDGTTRELVSNSTVRVKVGDTLPLSFPPDDPADASVRNQVWLHLLFSIIFLGTGGLWVVIWICAG